MSSVKPVYFKIFILAGLVAAAWLYFIPAFRGDIAVSSDLQIGPVRLHWYGLLMAAAILAGFVVARAAAPRFGFSVSTVEQILPWVVVGGFIGARVYYVAFFWEYFSANPGEILAVWKGGLAIYGAIIGAATGLVFAGLRYRLPLPRALDLAALAAPLGQSIGRFGNFFNQEAFGAPTSLPWGMHVSLSARPLQYAAEKFFHPAFLYESLWDFGVFLILVYCVRQSRRPGFLAGSYLILYSLGRYFIESVRLDSFFVSSIRVDQLVSLLMMLAGAFILSRTKLWQREE